MLRSLLIAQRSCHIAAILFTNSCRHVKILPNCYITTRRSYANVQLTGKEPKTSLESTDDTEPILHSDDGKKRKILELEMEVMRQEGRKVPTPAKIKEAHWQHLLQLDTRNQRRQYYLYLWNIEMSKENQRIKKEQRKIEIAKRQEELNQEKLNNNHLVYGLHHNTMFLRIYDTKIDQFNNNKLIQAMQFGQKLVIDCSYDEYMNDREMRNTGEQLSLCFALNRMHNAPFDIHHCNANFNNRTIKSLESHLVRIHEATFPFNVTEKSYLDLFPREKLVYLTPHCQNDLTSFNADDIYIVGAMVDKSCQEAISLGKAKKQGLRMARLPLDKYFQFKSNKSLTLDQMLKILLELKTSNDFQKALQHVPRRKIVPLEEQQLQQQKQRTKEKRDSNKFKFSMGSFNEKKYSKR